MSDTSALGHLLLLLQLGDSTLPVGGFAFSQGLEGAVAAGVVASEEQLSGYLHTVAHTVAHTDALAAEVARECALTDNMQRLVATDNRLLRSKSSHEARRQALLMGQRLRQLLLHLFPLRAEVVALEGAASGGRMQGCYATSMGIAAAVVGLSDVELFGLMLYGCSAQLLSAALRLGLIDHLASQRLLLHIGDLSPHLWSQIEGLTEQHISTFAPLTEVCTSLHEKGPHRLFMN